MRAMEAEEERGRIDGKQGETGKVIKNSGCRCFSSTSKWCACQQRHPGLMHYWAGAHLAPGADIPFPIRLAAREHVDDGPGHASPRRPGPWCDGGHQGTRSTCSTPSSKTANWDMCICKLHEKNECFKSSVYISEENLHLVFDYCFCFDFVGTRSKPFKKDNATSCLF